MLSKQEILISLNPWWKTGKISIIYKDRSIYPEIKNFIKYKQIICITGLRRTGKSTLLKKIISDKIQEGFDPKKIIYFSFDEYNKLDLRELLKEYQLLNSLDSLDKEYLLILDEIQKLKNWNNKVKAIYDQYPNIKIIITGSESTFIKKKTKETLAGRIFEFRLKPLSFKEFLIFKNIDYTNTDLYSLELKNKYKEYIITQGFPELIDIKDETYIKKYISENIISNIVSDIIFNYKIKEIEVLINLINIIIESPGQIIDIAKISKDLNISRQTISNYLRYMEDGFFLHVLYNFSNNVRKSRTKLKKYYPLVFSPDLVLSNNHLYLSKAFESLIVTQLDALFFWRDKYKHEVDIVLVKEEQPFPIEIKFGNIDSYDSVRAFLKKHKLKELTIITFEKEQEVKLGEYTITLVPAYKYFSEK